MLSTISTSNRVQPFNTIKSQQDSQLASAGTWAYETNAQFPRVRKLHFGFSGRNMAGLTNEEASRAIELLKQVDINMMLPSADGYPKKGGLGDVVQDLPSAILRLALSKDVPWHMEAIVPIRVADIANLTPVPQIPNIRYQATNQSIRVFYTDPQTNEYKSTEPFRVHKLELPIQGKSVTVYGLPFKAYQPNPNLIGAAEKAAIKHVIQNASEAQQTVLIKDLSKTGLNVQAILDDKTLDINTATSATDGGALNTLGNTGSGVVQRDSLLNTLGNTGSGVVQGESVLNTIGNTGSGVVQSDNSNQLIKPEQLVKAFKEYLAVYSDAVNETIFSKACYALGMLRSGDDISELQQKYGVQIDQTQDGFPLSAYQHQEGKIPVDTYIVNDWNPQIGVDIARRYIASTLKNKLIVGFNHNIDVGRRWQGGSLDAIRTVMTVPTNQVHDSVPESEWHPMERALWAPDTVEDPKEKYYWPSVTINNPNGTDGSIINAGYAAYFMTRPDTPQHATVLAQYNRGGLNHNHHGVNDNWFATSPENTDLEGGQTVCPALIDTQGNTHERKTGLSHHYQRLPQDIASLPLPDAIKAMQEYKQKNLAAFQEEVGLEPNPKAKLYFVTGRMTFQKGYGLVANVVKEFLNKNPDAQVVLLTGPLSGLDPDDDQGQQFMANYADIAREAQGSTKENPLYKLEKKGHDLAGRLAVVPIFSEGLVRRGLAASSVNWMMSLFEPFGIVQGQARAHATPTFVPWLDGPRTNIINPNQSLKVTASRGLPLIPSNLDYETAKLYDQTGWFTDPVKFDNDAVRNEYPKLRSLQIPHLDQAEAAIQNQLQAIHNQIQDPDELAKIQLNSIRYALQEDTWDAAAITYFPPLMLSILGNTNKNLGIPDDVKAAMRFYTDHAKGSFERELATEKLILNRRAVAKDPQTPADPATLRAVRSRLVDVNA